MLWLPAARRAPLSGQPGFPWQVTCPTKGVLHTTEGGNGVPSYTPGFKAPHLTVLVTPGQGVDPVQHIPFDRASYSLVHAPGTVATNGAHAIQVELCGTSDPSVRGRYFWPNADDAVLADLYRKVIKPLNEAFGIKLKAPTWKAYPASYGAPRPLFRAEAAEPSPLASPVDPSERTEDDPGAPEGALEMVGTDGPLGSGNGVRLSEATWLGWDGWAGHQHVPGGNVHGDPGLFPWARLLAVAGQQPPNPPNPPGPRPLVVDGTLGVDTVRRWQSYLNAHGAKPRLDVDGGLGPRTWAAVDVWLGVTPANGIPGHDTIRALQRKVGTTADGILGPATIKALQKYLNAHPAK
jgi:hypothetical protein